MDEKVKEVPYIVYEAAESRHERVVKRLITALITTVILLFTSNIIWLYYWNQWDYMNNEVTYSQDGQGVNVIGDGNNVPEIDDKN